MTDVSDTVDSCRRPPTGVSAHWLVADAVAHRLGRDGLAVPPELVRASGEEPRTSLERNLGCALRELTEEFERRYAEVYTEMCGSLAVTPSNAESTFNSVVGQLFQGGTVNWGRIVALFAFSGALAVFCVRKSMASVVREFVIWTARYIDNYLQRWIDANGGWENLLEFYENREENRNGEWSWPCISSLCGYVFSAVGMVTLSAVLSRK